MEIENTVPVGDGISCANCHENLGKLQGCEIAAEHLTKALRKTQDVLYQEQEDCAVARIALRSCLARIKYLEDAMNDLVRWGNLLRDPNQIAECVEHWDTAVNAVLQPNIRREP